MAKDLTDEEYDALDELWTRTTPEIDTSKPGYFTTHIKPLIEAKRRIEDAETVPVDKLTAGWLRAKAEATHKTPAELIGELVRKELASAS
jgi:hypothetical protein